MMKNVRKICVSSVLFVSVFLLITGCASSGNSIENIPRQVLLSSSESLMVEGKEVILNAQLNRDVCSDTSEDGSPLLVKVEVVTSDGGNLPDGLNTDAVWVIVDDEIWGSAYSGEQLRDDRTRIVKIVKNGPEFGIGNKADVFVRIRYDGNTYLLRTSSVEIEQVV
jgi:hypothetical protein